MNRERRYRVAAALTVFLAGLVSWWALSWAIGERLLYESMVPDLREAHVEGTVLCVGSSVFLSESGARKLVEVLDKHDMGVELDPGDYCAKTWKSPFTTRWPPDRFFIRMERKWGVVVRVSVTTVPVKLRGAIPQAGHGYRGWYLFIGYRWVPLNLEFWIA